MRCSAHEAVSSGCGPEAGKIVALRKATENDDLLAATCVLEALRGDTNSAEAVTGALLLVEAAKWIVAIGRGLSNG